MSGTANATATVATEALRIDWNETGRIIRIRCGPDDITGPGVSASGFALRDCAVQERCEAISGELTALDNGVRFEGRNRAGALAVSARCMSENDWVVVRGEVSNLTEADRAVSLRFALPVSCTGWKWAKRLHKTEPLLAGRKMHLGTPTQLGTGHMALRPVAAISDEAHSVGLVMPLDYIGLYDFNVDVDRGLFSVVIDFAMTRHSPRHFKKVPFEFYIDGKADGWGLRSVLARYYANRAELFERHTPEAGGWFAWGDILRQPPPICDYGLMFHEQPESEEAYAHDKALGIRVYPYIEPFMYQMCLGDQPKDKRPTRELIMGRLREWAKPETTGRLPSGGWRTQEALQRICRALSTYGPRDAEGDDIIGAIGQYNWISGTKWAAQFPLDLTPGIPDGAGQDRLRYVRDNLLTRPHLTGIYLDSMANHLSRADYAKEKLEYLTYPPLFDAETFEPCTIVGLAACEWVEALWDMLPPDKKELLPNLYGQRVPLPWHRLTVMGKEHWTDPAGPLMQQYRCMAHRKVVTQLPAYEDRDERFLRNLMLLGVFPGGYARRSTDPPQGMRASYRLVIPLLRQLHRLGWEPITHAAATASGIMAERYGRAPGPIAFAVQNPYDADIVRLQIDGERLALPVDAFPIDVIDAAAVEYSRKGDTLDVATGLEGDSTTLLVVGNRRAHGEWLRMLADDRLNDVRLCLKEYALRHEVDTHPAWAAVAQLTSAGDAGTMVSASKAITGDEPTAVRARELLDLAAKHVSEARSPSVRPSRRAMMPGSDVALPWSETFEKLSPERWQPSGASGIRVRNGRLEMELPGDATRAEISTTESWPFVPRPLAIETDFQFSHGEHDRYLRLSMRIGGTAAGAGEYLLLRIDGSSPESATIRVENHNAPPTKWQHTLTEWTRFDVNQPHHLRLRLDRDTFRLELDEKLVGEGAHECSFGWAYITLGVYSGHRGHGDVCWWDDLKVNRTP